MVIRGMIGHTLKITLVGPGAGLELRERQICNHTYSGTPTYPPDIEAMNGTGLSESTCWLFL